MSERSYDRAPAAVGQESQLSQAAFVNLVFGWMTGALALTAGISYAIANSPVQDFMIENRGAYWLLCLVELFVVIALTASVRKISSLIAAGGLILYAALNGVTFSWIFMVYDSAVIYQAFFSASLMFGGAGLFGYITRKDLSGVGSTCLMALWGLIVASVINLFWGNSRFSLLISFAGVIIFAGLTAWDMQKVKLTALALEEGLFDAETGKKAAVYSALELYLDFINLFLHFLRLLSRR